MKYINQIIFALTLACGAVGTTGCSSWLEENPESMIGPGNVGDSKEAVDTWVTGVYSNWLYDMFCWDEFPRVLELDADYICGPDWLFGAMGAGNFQSESSLNKMWSGPYNLINDANVAIRYIEAMGNVDADYKNNALGELYFQKAFCYFLLVRAYGPIPYLSTDVSDGAEFYNPRKPVAEIYEHIIDLLTQAADLMYNFDNSNYQAGHVSAGSAAGLLAKVYATMAAAAMPEGTEVDVRTGEPFETVAGEQHYRLPTTETFKKKAVAGYEDMNAQELYEKAAEWAKKVIDGKYGNYQLLAYDDLWKKSSKSEPEFMFVIGAGSAIEDNYRNGVHTYYSGYTDASNSYILSGGFVGCTNNWYNLFDEQDYRAAKGVRHFWRLNYQLDYNGCFYYPQSWSIKVTGMDVDGNWVREPDAEYAATGYAYQYNQSSECLAFTTKYDDVDNPSINNANAAWPFLRYADVMLIYAEAENELGHQDEAMAYLNQVRIRSNAKLMETVGTKTGLRSAIIEERAKELACEGDRRWDLIRWGIYIDAMNAVGRDDANNQKTRTERNLLYPIPTAEMDVNKAITANNPGWD